MEHDMNRYRKLLESFMDVREIPYSENTTHKEVREIINNLYPETKNFFYVGEMYRFLLGLEK